MHLRLLSSKIWMMKLAMTITKLSLMRFTSSSLASVVETIVAGSVNEIRQMYTHRNKCMILQMNGMPPWTAVLIGGGHPIEHLAED